jgi:sugar lactone lactonase YvrE
MMPSKPSPRMLCCALLALVCALLLPAPASAQFKAWVLAKLPDTPEGLALDAQGHLYATLFHTGEVVRIRDDGGYEHVAWVPSKEESGQGLLLGIDFDRAGHLYAAYKQNSRWDAGDLVDPQHPACRDATVTRSGVYRIDVGTGKVKPLATRAGGWPFCFPDDIAVDRRGNVYLADLTYSGIWKIAPGGTQVDLWSAGELLNWPDPPYSHLMAGVNDLVLDKGEQHIYAITDGSPMVLRIPIDDHGRAGQPRPLEALGYQVPDGIELDSQGHVFVADVVRNEIWVLSRDGRRRILIASKENAPLDEPTSLVIRRGKQGDVLCVANLGYSHRTPAEAERTIVCMSGYAVPQ